MRLKSKHTNEIVRAISAKVEPTMADQFGIKLKVYRGEVASTTGTSYYYTTLSQMLEDWEDA